MVNWSILWKTIADLYVAFISLLNNIMTKNITFNTMLIFFGNYCKKKKKMHTQMPINESILLYRLNLKQSCISNYLLAWIWQVDLWLETCRYIYVYGIDMMFWKERCGCILWVINMKNLLEVVLDLWLFPSRLQWCYTTLKSVYKDI